MNETARMLMQKINEASFAMDDVILYLDTHPDDRDALNYYHYVVNLRKDAMDAYQSQFGPLMPDGVRDNTAWSWLAGKWPWEGEV